MISLELMILMDSIKDLFRSAWDSKNWERAVNAVEKIKDEAKLERVAKEARDWSARKAAVRRVTNQSFLADVARNDKEWRVCSAAVERMTDQSLLADVAKNGKNRYIGLVAVERVTDQRILTDIAQNNEDWLIRLTAVNRLTDQKMLAHIALHDNNRYVCFAASHQPLNPDLEEDLLMHIIHMLGDVLRTSNNKSERSRAAESLLIYYRRYRNDKLGKEIRKYKGEYKGGYSDYSDTGSSSCCPENHPDYHDDETYTIDFNPPFISTSKT